MSLEQPAFDEMIGRLDRILSEMVEEGKVVKAADGGYDPINIQTLKHHAEDMILAGRKILRDIGNFPEPSHG